MVVVLATMLFLGERFSNSLANNSLVPAGEVTAQSQSLFIDENIPQNQIVSKSFIIRPGTSRLSYDEALGLYQNATLQFNEDCQLSSASRSFGLNNEVLIDNRSSKSRKIKIGEISMIVGPYDFGFMILREKGTNISVDCNDRKNIANLIIQ